MFSGLLALFHSRNWENVSFCHLSVRGRNGYIIGEILNNCM